MDLFPYFFYYIRLTMKQRWDTGNGILFLLERRKICKIREQSRFMNISLKSSLSASHSAVLVRHAYQDFHRGIDDGISSQNPGGRFHVLRTNFKVSKFFVGQMCTFQISNLVYEIPDHSHQINNLRLGMHFSFQVLYITFLAWFRSCLISILKSVP